MILKIKKLNTNAIIPTYESEFAAGLDIYACDYFIIPPNKRAVIPTGIAINWTGENEKEYYMRIAPRSGLSVKSSIDIGAGVIDWDYRGEIKICMINNSDTEFYIKPKDRIAQMILERINRFNKIIESELDDTTRGIGGFGSTGI